MNTRTLATLVTLLASGCAVDAGSATDGGDMDDSVESADLDLLVERTGGKGIGRVRKRCAHQLATVVIATTSGSWVAVNSASAMRWPISPSA